MQKIGDYLLIKSLGKGSFGEVFLTQKQNNPTLYATKKINLSKLSSKDGMRYIKNEIKIMKQLDHENIIKLHDCYQTAHSIYLIMDYINGGSLSDFLSKYKLKNGEPLPQKAIHYIVKQIVNGLIYIHSKNIIHRDIKLDNILINFPTKSQKENLDYSLAQIKIIDFGLSTQADLAKSAVGSPLYMDPVILEKYKKAGGIEKFKSYDKKADIWSLGVITYEMLTGESLFKASGIDDLIKKVEKGDYSLEVRDLTNEIISFLNCMLQIDPKKRLPATELAKHQFLTGNPDNFKKIDTSQIEYKIKNGVITLNIINNETIAREFPFKPEDFLNSLSINLELISDKFSKGNKIEDLKVDEPIIDKKEDKIIENNNIAQNNNFNSVLPISEISGNPINHNSNLNQLQLKQMTTQIISGDIDNISKEDNLNSQQPIKKTKSEKIVQINKNDDDNFQKGTYKAAKSGNIEKMIKKKDYEIKFQVSRIDNKKENLNLYIKFLVNEKSTLEQIVNLKMENDFQEEWIWKFTSNDWINIDNNNENFVMKIDINKIGMKPITANVEKIKLGKPISFLAPNYIKFELTPIIKEINI